MTSCPWCNQPWPVEEFLGLKGDDDLTKICPVCGQDYDLEAMGLGLVAVEARYKS